MIFPPSIYDLLENAPEHKIEYLKLSARTYAGIRVVADDRITTSPGGLRDLDGLRVVTSEDVPDDEVWMVDTQGTVVKVIRTRVAV